MQITLNIIGMHCWAPNADGVKEWRVWLQQNEHPQGNEPPPLSHIKPMQRRRLSLLARSVFETSARCLEQIPEQHRSTNDVGCLFANAYGQCDTTVKMLQTLAQAEPTSPAAFSLSVHNAIAGQFSIAHMLTGASATMAPGRDGLGGVFLEAAGLLEEQRCKYLLLCCFEAPIPDTLKPYDVNPPTPMAAAFLLRQPPAGQPLLDKQQDAGITLKMQRSIEQPVLYGSPFWRQVLEFVE